MDNNQLNPLFQITDPTYGKSEIELIQEQIKKAQQQSLNSQLQGIKNTEGQIANSNTAPNKAAGIAAALGQIVSPESNSFNTYMQTQQLKQNQANSLQDRLLKQNKGLASTAGSLANQMGKPGAFGSKKEELDYKHKQALQRIMANKKDKDKAADFNGFTIPETAGSKKLDQTFAKQNADFYGKTVPKLDSNIKNLKEVSRSLGTYGEGGKFKAGSKNLTGTSAGMAIKMGSTFGGAINSEATNAYDLVRQVVQQDLRETLGAQFTENEGNLMIAATYNPSLPPEMNKKRLDRLLEKTEKMKSIRKKQNDYFRKRGTLRDFDYEKMDAEIASLSQEIKDEFMPKDEETPKASFKSKAAQDLAKEFGL